MNVPSKHTEIVATIMLIGELEKEDGSFRPTYEYAAPFIESALLTGCHPVLIHDGCIDDERILHHPGMTVISVDPSKRTSPNPFMERYFLYLELLKQNEHLSTIFFSDVRDVFFYHNPHRFFKHAIEHDKIIVQEEWSPFTENKEYMKRLNVANRRPDILDLNIAIYRKENAWPLCAGFFGGRRNKMIELLNEICRRFIPACDCQEFDMAIFNYVLYEILTPEKLAIFKCGIKADQLTDEFYRYERKHYTMVLVSNNNEYVTPLMHHYETVVGLLENLRKKLTLQHN